MDKKGVYNVTEKKCPICGKSFIAAPMHTYKVNNRYVCSWGCVRTHEKKKGIKL
jgi:predicted RNA-binding Zn-ribbon protein involved in translation (DUF1610 family)